MESIQANAGQHIFSEKKVSDHSEGVVAQVARIPENFGDVLEDSFPSKLQRNMAAQVLLAIQNDNLEFSLLQQFVDNGLNINMPTTQEGDTLLHHAAYYGQYEAVKILLKVGADLSKANVSGNTPLHFAAYKGQLPTLITLLNAGASVDGRNKDGSTAMHLAVYKNRVDVVRSLLEAGASINIKDNRGKTAFDIAIHKKHANVEAVLAAHKYS